MKQAERPHWSEQFWDAYLTHTTWHPEIYLGPQQRWGTLWLWTFGLVAGFLWFAPHPFTMFCGIMGGIAWIVAIVGTWWLNKHYRKEDTE